MVSWNYRNLRQIGRAARPVTPFRPLRSLKPLSLTPLQASSCASATPTHGAETGGGISSVSRVAPVADASILPREPAAIPVRADSLRRLGSIYRFGEVPRTLAASAVGSSMTR